MSVFVCIWCDAKFDNAEPLPKPCPYCGLSIGYIAIEDAVTMRKLVLAAMDGRLGGDDDPKLAQERGQ